MELIYYYIRFMENAGEGCLISSFHFRCSDSRELNLGQVDPKIHNRNKGVYVPQLEKVHYFQRT